MSQDYLSLHCCCSYGYKISVGGMLGLDTHLCSRTHMRSRTHLCSREPLSISTLAKVGRLIYMQVATTEMETISKPILLSKVVVDIGLVHLDLRYVPLIIKFPPNGQTLRVCRTRTSFRSKFALNDFEDIWARLFHQPMRLSFPDDI